MDNIRIRASNFISLQDSISLAISQTNISRMDFTSGFIGDIAQSMGGRSQIVVLSDLSVTGFNRDHAYVRDYPGDTGFLKLASVSNFTLVNSVFEDNLLLQNTKKLSQYIIEIDNYDYFAIFTCVFRRTMSGLKIYHSQSVRTIPELVISRSLFEGNYMVNNAFLKINALTSVDVTITECVFKSNTVSYVNFMRVSLYDNSSLQFSQCEFHSNWPFLSSHSSFYPSTLEFIYLEVVAGLIISNSLFRIGEYNGEDSLMALLAATHLINPSKELMEDFLEASPQTYFSILITVDWGQVRVVNTTIKESFQYESCLIFTQARPEARLLLNYLMVNNVVTAQTVLRISTSSNLRNPILILNSIFKEVSGEIIVVNGENNQTFVQISNCLFVDINVNSLETILLAGTSAEIIASKWWGCSSNEQLVFFVALSSHGEQKFVMRDCEFLNNTGGADRGDISISSVEDQISVALEISNSSFQDFSGYAIHIVAVELRQAAMRNCSFTGGRVAPRTELILIAHAKGLLLLEDVHFSKINCSQSYLIHVNTPCANAQEKLTRLLRVVVRDCIFLAAVKLEGQLLQTYAETVNCSFLGNQGIVIWSDVAVIRDQLSLFQANTADGFPCYFQDQQSNAFFEHTQFRGNRAVNTFGGCLYLRGYSSSATFTNCLFQDNTARGITAGVMRIEEYVRVDIHDCAFFQNSASVGSALYLQSVEVPLHIDNTSFVGNKGEGFIYLINSKLSLKNVLISRNEGYNAGGLMLVNSQVRVVNSEFSELQGKQGCVLLVDSDSSVTFETTQVRNMHCTGNMMDFSLGSSLLLIDCQFSSLASEARIIDIQEGKFFQASSLYVKNITAAAFLSVIQTDVSVQNSTFSELFGQVFNCTESTLMSIRNSSFSNVSGTSLIFCSKVRMVELQRIRITTVWTDMGIVLKGSEVWIENCVLQAMLTGMNGTLFLADSKISLSDSFFLSNQALASNSKGGALSLFNSSSVITNCTFVSNSAFIGGAIYWTALPPHQQNNVFANNRAYYGPNIASETHRLQVFNLSGLVFASGQTVAGPLLLGILDRSNQLVLVESSKYWLKGDILSGNLEAKADRGLIKFTEFIVEKPPGHTVSIILNANVTVSNIIAQLRACKAGEVLDKEHCVTCPFSTYSVDFLGCSRCPSGGVCPGDGNLYPESSYWRPTESYNGVFVCSNKAACKGHSNYTSQMGLCAEQYEGNLCQKCTIGSGRNGPDKCAHCPSPTTNYIIITAALAGTAIVIVILTRSALIAQKNASLAGTVMKILLNYIQITTLIARFPLNWPPVLDQYFTFHEYGGNAGEQYMSVDCLVSDSVFNELILMAVLPLALTALTVLVWSLIWTFFKVFQRSIRIKEKWVCSTIVSLLYFHPMIMRKTFSAFQCFTLLPGEQWLRVELSIRCWTGPHSFFALAVALPAAVLWGVGIPSLALQLLVRYRKRLREDRVREMVGYLCANYKAKLYFWEVIIIYRKLSVVALLAFTSNLSTITQGLSLVLLLSALALLQFTFAPFKRIVLNNSELLGEVTAILTVYAGLFFQFDFLSAGVDTVLFAMILALNMFFLLYLLYALFRNKLRLWLRRLKQANKLKKPPCIRRSSKGMYVAQLQRQFFSLNNSPN